MKHYIAFIENGKHIRTGKASKLDTEELIHDNTIDVNGSIMSISLLNYWQELKVFTKHILVKYPYPLKQSSSKKEALIRSIRIWEYIETYGGNKYQAHLEIGAGSVNIQHNQCGLCHYLNNNKLVDEINENTCTDYCPVKWADEFPSSNKCDSYTMPCEVEGTPYYEYRGDHNNIEAAQNMVKVLKKTLAELPSI